MEKIEFSNYQEPGISAETLNQMQENIERAINGDDTWQKLELSGNFKPYSNNDSNTPIYKKSGNMVEVMGAISPAATISAGSKVLIGTLPLGCRPKKGFNKLCQGSTKNSWLLDVEASGELYFSRYGTTSYANAGTSVWLPFEASFFVS